MSNLVKLAMALSSRYWLLISIITGRPYPLTFNDKLAALQKFYNQN